MSALALMGGKILLCGSEASGGTKDWKEQQEPVPEKTYSYL